MTTTQALDRLTIATRRGVTFLALLVTGCSFVIRGPPPRPIRSDAPIRCNTSRVAPVLDTLMAFPLIAGGVGVFAAATTCRPNPQRFFDLCPTNKAAAAAASLSAAAVGGLFLWSAIRGFDKTGECREVVESQRDCLAGVDPACDCLAGVGAACDARKAAQEGAKSWRVDCTSDLDCIGAGANCHWGTCEPPTK